MRQAFSPLAPPLAKGVRPWQRVTLSSVPADQSIPDRPIVAQLKFRRGLFFQLLNRVVLAEIPADQSVPDRPPLRPYPFRRGGFWQPQKILVFPTPADQSVPDQQIVAQYVFRPGRLWKIQRRFELDVISVQPLPPPLPPPAPPPAFVSGGPPYKVKPKRVRIVRWRYDLEALQALYAVGEIDEEEYAALLADARETVGLS